MTMSEPTPCECPGPSFCPRYGLQMNAYAHSICSGQGCSPEKTGHYQSKWRKIAEERSSRGIAVITPINPQQSASNATIIPQARTRRTIPPVPLGPGTELKNILASIGLTPQGCRCETRVAQMNQWGIEGCKQPANREAIINWLRTEEKKRGWGDKIKAGLLTITTGLVAELSPTDPLGSIVDVAISRAEERVQKGLTPGNTPEVSESSDKM